MVYSSLLYFSASELGYLRLNSAGMASLPAPLGRRQKRRELQEIFLELNVQMRMMWYYRKKSLEKVFHLESDSAEISSHSLLAPVMSNRCVGFE